MTVVEEGACCLPEVSDPRHLNSRCSGIADDGTIPLEALHGIVASDFVLLERGTRGFAGWSPRFGSMTRHSEQGRRRHFPREWEEPQAAVDVAQYLVRGNLGRVQNDERGYFICSPGSALEPRQIARGLRQGRQDAQGRLYCGAHMC